MKNNILIHFGIKKNLKRISPFGFRGEFVCRFEIFNYETQLGFSKKLVNFKFF